MMALHWDFQFNHRRNRAVADEGVTTDINLVCAPQVRINPE